MINIGDELLITYMEGESAFTPMKGFVTREGRMGQYFGTWGRVALIPECDKYEILSRVEDRQNPIEWKKQEYCPHTFTPGGNPVYECPTCGYEYGAHEIYPSVKECPICKQKFM